MESMVERIAGCVALALAAVLATGCEATFFRVLNAGSIPASIAIDRDVVYATDTGQRYAFVGEALAASGIVAVLPDYREYPAVRFPAFVEDAARAVGWARQHARALGGNSSRLYVAGHSAGGHIAALLGTDAHYLRAQGFAPRDLAGVIAIAGPHDFLPITEADLAEIFGPPERYPASQPVNFVDGDEPPFLLLHGSDDDIVRTRNSVSLAERLLAAHEPGELRLYPGVGHIRILAAMDLSYDGLAPTLDDVKAFVGR
jgi:acetyl esterase/lipase